jgi:hypothetical protein
MISSGTLPSLMLNMMAHVGDRANPETGTIALFSIS